MFAVVLTDVFVTLYAVLLNSHESINNIAIPRAARADEAMTFGAVGDEPGPDLGLHLQDTGPPTVLHLKFPYNAAHGVVGSARTSSFRDVSAALLHGCSREAAQEEPNDSRGSHGSILLDAGCARL